MSFLCCCFNASSEEDEAPDNQQPFIHTALSPERSGQQLTATSTVTQFNSPQPPSPSNVDCLQPKRLTFERAQSQNEAKYGKNAQSRNNTRRSTTKIQKKEDEEEPTLKHSMTVSFIDARGGMLAEMRTSKSTIRMGTVGNRSVRHSALWEEDTGTKIIHSVTRKDEEMVLAFKLSQLCPLEDSCLSYILSSRRGIHKNTIPGQEPSLALILSNRPPCETKPFYHARGLPNHVRTVFGVVQGQDTQTQPSKFYESQDIVETINMGSNCIRLEVFDSIVVKLQHEKDFEALLEFAHKASHNFELEQMAKTIWVLPAQTSLSQLALLLSRLMRRFVISEPLQKVLQHISWQVEMLCGEKFGEVMLVRHGTGGSTGSYQIKVELAVALLQMEVTANNAKPYQNFVDTFFTDMSTLEYVQYVDFLQESKSVSNPLEELKVFTPDELKMFQGSPKTESKEGKEGERWVTFKSRFKNSMREYFIDYRYSQTPIDESSQREEWDDKLVNNQILVGTLDADEDHYSTDNFEEIDDDIVEGADLDIIQDLLPASSYLEETAAANGATS